MAKLKKKYAEMMRNWRQHNDVALESRMLAPGAGPYDVAVLNEVGFSQVTYSNLGSSSYLTDSKELAEREALALDLEDIDCPDNSYDIVFVHGAIHHCRSPHRAICEMLRVSSRHVVFVEPNDSAFMRLMIRLGLSFPFEIAAVVDSGFVAGGVRNTDIPNWVFRWNTHEVKKLVLAFMPERFVKVSGSPYWDFNIDEKEPAKRKLTKLKYVIKVFGAKNFLRILRASQRVANFIPWVSAQGNKFFCHIEKTPDYRPWISVTEQGASFNREFRSGK
ncbi:MAG: class I SAM-dependent methyltransferase [Gammaproteobacteria bacterium]|nr:class I SAM-dependent methyltransferase [Gammaproteobacteria bacterium]NNL51573.1 methyltransferase domain-containing protein [Woeseiaceae bacterium]